MEMILLDWTRMGQYYCLAGAVVENNHIRIVRPLLAKKGQQPQRNLGWSPFYIEGHTRWEIFELCGEHEANLELPHSEDLWVRGLKPLQKLATPEQRRAILLATTFPPSEPLFGVPLQSTRISAFLLPGAGDRSLATVVVPGERIAFQGSWRSGMAEPDIRVTLPVPELGTLTTVVKDHHFLLKAEPGNPALAKRLQVLKQTIDRMGDRIAVRLGLSRGYQANPTGPAFCYLMADGFFSLADPQP